MSQSTRANLVLGAICIAFALVVALIWVPLDADTGLIEKVRRRLSIGDGLAPTVAAGFVLIGGLFLVLKDSAAPIEHRLTLGNLRYIAFLLIILAVSFAIMRWTGPLVAAISGVEGGYRPLRDTAGWKHIGYFLGASVLVSGLIALVEGKASLRAALIGAGAALAMILIYDLPFDDLLLPPNGDV